MDDNKNKEILLHGVVGELELWDKMEVIYFIENILGEMSEQRLDNILSALIEERISGPVL